MSTEVELQEDSVVIEISKESESQTLASEEKSSTSMTQKSTVEIEEEAAQGTSKVDEPQSAYQIRLQKIPVDAMTEEILGKVHEESEEKVTDKTEECECSL